LIECGNIAFALLIVKVTLNQFLHDIQPPLEVFLRTIGAFRCFLTVFFVDIFFAGVNREHLPDVYQVLFDLGTDHLQVLHFLSLSLLALSDHQTLPLVVLHHLHLQVKAPH
jgi:hypothetical protein